MPCRSPSYQEVYSRTCPLPKPGDIGYCNHGLQDNIERSASANQNHGLNQEPLIVPDQVGGQNINISDNCDWIDSKNKSDWIKSKTQSDWVKATCANQYDWFKSESECEKLNTRILTNNLKSDWITTEGGESSDNQLKQKEGNIEPDWLDRDIPFEAQLVDAETLSSESCESPNSNINTRKWIISQRKFSSLPVSGNHGISKLAAALLRIKGYSRSSLTTESGIFDSKAASSLNMSIKGSHHRSATMRAPTTPHAIRQKPPPKPPRLSATDRSLSTCSTLGSVRNYGAPASPGGNSTKSSFGDITLDSSFCSNYGGEMVQPISRVYPCSPQDKVYHIILQTKDFLVHEVDVRLLLAPLLDRKVLDSRAVIQLKGAGGRAAAAQLLLDMLMGKTPREFLVFCDILRRWGNCGHLADLLLALDCLVDLGSEDALKKRHTVNSPAADPENCNGHNNHHTLTNGTHNPVLVNGSPAKPKHLPNGRSDITQTESSPPLVSGELEACPVCVQNSKGLDLGEDMLMDTSSFDVELVYVDRDTGQVRAQKEVAELKGDKRSSLNADKAPEELVKHQADRYIPVITVSLYNYCLHDAGMDKVCRALDGKTCIREVSLSKCHLSLGSVRTLSRALQKNSGVYKLDLRLNSLPVECVSELAKGLNHSMSIKVVNLSSTDLSHEGTSILLNAISRNQVITELDIGFNDLTDTGCCVIAEAMATNCPLKKLRIRDNSIDFDGAFKLFKALKKNSRLTFLDVSSNSIGDRVLVTLSELLRHNRTLKHLNLENCGIGVEGCNSLARALKSNTVLKSLNLSMNNIGDSGLSGLSEGLKYNPVLDVLCLNMCEVSNVGFSRLLDSLQFNMTLKTLKLCYNKIGRTACPRCSLDCNRNNKEVDLEAVIPSIEEIYDKLCHILQQNQDLKVLLWGNKLDSDEEGEVGHECCCQDDDVIMTSHQAPVDSNFISSHSEPSVLVNGSVNQNGGVKKQLFPTQHVDNHVKGVNGISGENNNHINTVQTGPHLNQMQRDFVQQYTIQNHYCSDNNIVLSPTAYSKANTDIRHYGNELSVSIPSHHSCGSVSTHKVSPRMGTTGASVLHTLASNPLLHSDGTMRDHPRIRTNGSLPWRVKQGSTMGLSRVGLGVAVGGETGMEGVQGEGEFRPHTFPRRKKIQ